MINFRLKLPPAVLDESKSELKENVPHSAYTLDNALNIVICNGHIIGKKCYTHFR